MTKKINERHKNLYLQKQQPRNQLIDVQTRRTKSKKQKEVHTTRIRRKKKKRRNDIFNRTMYIEDIQKPIRGKNNRKKLNTSLCYRKIAAKMKE